MSISKGTIVRTIMMILVIVNIILQRLGYDIINVDENSVLAAVELLIEIAILIVGWWKNNSFSQNAIKADEYLRKLKYSDEDDMEYEESEEDEGGDL